MSPSHPASPAPITGKVVWSDARGVVVSNADGSDQQVVVANPTSTASSGSNITPADLSPDGREIIYSVNPGVSVPHTNRLMIARVGAGGAPPTPFEPGFAVYDPRWSPDGTKIAFDRFNVQTQVNDVYVASADGSGARLVAADGYRPSWSPDGSLLVFTAYNADTIMIVNVNGSGLRTLAAGSGAVWSPAGDEIAFDSGSAQPQITVENADGADPRVVPGLNSYLNDWDPSGTRLLVTTAREPSTLEVVDATSGASEVAVTITSAPPASVAASWQRPR